MSHLSVSVQESLRYSPWAGMEEATTTGIGEDTMTGMEEATTTATIAEVIKVVTTGIVEEATTTGGIVS